MKGSRANVLIGGDYEYFEHGADVGIRGFGSTPEAAFAAAARGMFALGTDDPGSVRDLEDVSVGCAADDLETLFVAYLNELVSLADSRNFVFSRFEAAIREAGGRLVLEGRGFGEGRDPERHGGTVEVKGATYTELRVTRIGERWVAQCVVDV